MSKLKVLVKVLISIFILIFLIYNIGIEKLYKTFFGVKAIYLPFVILTTSIEILLGATTLKILINCLDKRIGFWKIFRYFIRSFSIGLFLPAKIGEISFVYFLSKEQITLGKASAIFILDKIITFITLSLISIIGIFILFEGEQRIIILAFLGLSTLIMLYFIMSNSGRGFIKRYLLKKYASIFTGFSEIFFYFLKNKPQIIIFNFVLSLVRWTFGAFSVYIMFLALNYNPGFAYVWLIKPLIIIIGLIPITIAGLGIREGSAILLFNMINVPAHITASVFFVFTGINYISAGIINLYYLNKNENTNIKPVISKE